jgi:hypothetical protein
VTYALPGPIPAGGYHLVADGYVSGGPEIRFDVAWRRAGTGDASIVSFDHPYPTTPQGAVAQYEETKMGGAVAAQSGDLLVLTLSLVGADASQEYVPIGERDSTPDARRLSLDVP